MARRNHGIFCLEGDWWGDLSKNNSMEPMLQLLRNSPRRLRYIHRNVATPTELEEYLRLWTRTKYKRFPILYLGFHGSAGNIHVGDQRKTGNEVTFDHLSKLLKNKCEGKIIHFGSCETLDWHGARLKTFLRTTGACCVTGYEKDIDWIPSAAFELFLFTVLQRSTLTKMSLGKVTAKIKEEIRQLSDKARVQTSN